MTHLVHLTRTEAIKVNYYVELTQDEVEKLKIMSESDKIKYLENKTLKVGSEELQEVLGLPSLYYFHNGETVSLIESNQSEK